MTEADLQCSRHGTRTHPAPNPDACRECKLLHLLAEARADFQNASDQADALCAENAALLALLREPGEDVLEIVARAMWKPSHDGAWPDDADGPEIWRGDAANAIAALCRHAEEMAERAAANPAGDDINPDRDVTPA